MALHAWPARRLKRKLSQGCRSCITCWFRAILASLGPTPSSGAAPCWPRAESRRIRHHELLRRGPQPPAQLCTGGPAR